MVRKRAPYCAKLYQAAAFSPVDVCGLPPGHEGEHVGRYRGARWATVRDKGAKRDRNQVIDHPK